MRPGVGRGTRRGWAAGLLPALLLVALVAGRAGAQEVRLGVQALADHSDRLLGNESGFGLRLRPDVELRDPRGALDWSLRYTPSYEYFPEFPNASGFNHDLRATATWQITRRTTLSATERFRSLNSARLFNEQVVTEGGETINVAGGTSERLTNNFLSAELRHRLSRADTLTLSLRSRFFDRADVGDGRGTGTQNSMNTNVTAQYQRVLSRRSSMGLGLSAARNDVEQDLGEDDATNFFNLFASWRYRFSESLTLSLGGGPALIDSDSSERSLSPAVVEAFPRTGVGEHVDATTCPVNDLGERYLPPNGDCGSVGDLGFLAPGVTVARPEPGATVPSGTDTRVSFFANASVIKRWEDWRGSLRFRRRESSSGQFGASTIADVLTGSLSWSPGPRWSFNLIGQWNRSTQATDRAASVLSVGEVGTFFGTDNDLGAGGQDLPPEAAFVTGVSTATIESDAESVVITGRFSARYKLTRRIGLFGNAFYAQRQGDFVEEEDDDLRLTLGISYDFDPMRF